MTLEQWAYIAEIIAAIAVIASLVYVARALRQNTNEMRVNNADSFVDFNFRLNTPIATDREFAEVWNKGWSEFGSLDTVDQQRVVIYDFQAIAGWHNHFNLKQQGLMSDAQWTELNGSLGIFGQRQAAREAWKRFRSIYDQPFRDFVAQYLESDEGDAHPE